MFRKLSKILLLTISCWLLTGPQLLLQLGAWSWMIASYSQESSIEQAFRETFGGDKPCDLCLIIEDVETQSDPVQERSKTREIKLLPIEYSTLALIPLESAKLSWNNLFMNPKSNLDSVPTPPPRA